MKPTYKNGTRFLFKEGTNCFVFELCEDIDLNTYSKSLLDINYTRIDENEAYDVNKLLRIKLLCPYAHLSFISLMKCKKLEFEKVIIGGEEYV